jgi:hypothetical protein
MAETQESYKGVSVEKSCSQYSAKWSRKLSSRSWASPESRAATSMAAALDAGEDRNIGPGAISRPWTAAFKIRCSSRKGRFSQLEAMSSVVPNKEIFEAKHVGAKFVKESMDVAKK